MKIIIAPAKKMKVDQDSFLVQTQPQFLEKTQVLLDFLRSRNFDQLKEIWRANNKIIKTNQLNLERFELNSQLSPSIVAFNGIQYQYIGADVLEQSALDYLQENLRIVSGFYGLLRPFDGIIPYRLEMGAPMVGFRDYSLYHFWGEDLYQSLYEKNDNVINLASKEYARAIEPYIQPTQKFITVTFLEKKKDKWRQIATHSKMARGAMVRFMAQNKVNDVEKIKDFHDFGFQFDSSQSTENNLVFKKNNE